MKCIETRRRRSGLVYRQYEADDGLRFGTYEMPVSVAKAIGVKKLQVALARWARGQATRSRAAAVRSAVLARRGEKPAAIANDLKVTEQRVRQILREAV